MKVYKEEGTVYDIVWYTAPMSDAAESGSTYLVTYIYARCIHFDF